VGGSRGKTWILHLVKTLLRSEGELKTCPEKRSFREFVSGRCGVEQSMYSLIWVLKKKNYQSMDRH
jgi:hypothetical protein